MGRKTKQTKNKKERLVMSQLVPCIKNKIKISKLKKQTKITKTGPGKWSLVNYHLLTRWPGCWKKWLDDGRIYRFFSLLGCSHTRYFSPPLWKEERQHQSLWPSCWGKFPWWSLGEASWEQSIVNAVSEPTAEPGLVKISEPGVRAVSVSPGWSPGEACFQKRFCVY